MAIGGPLYCTERRRGEEKRREGEKKEEDADGIYVFQLVFTAYLVCQLGGVIYGTGRHIWDLTPENAVKALRYWFFCEVFYVLGCCVLKVSIGVFLLRIAVQRLHIWIIRIFIVGTIIFGAVYDGIILFQCNPISAWWTLDRHGCIDPQIVVDATYAASAINAVADWTFGTLPIFMVRGLNMSKRTKTIVICILSFAAMCVFFISLSSNIQNCEC